MKSDRQIPLYHIAAFVSSGSHTGNPAAVCLVDDECDADWMQRVASELNLSETAFVQRDGEDCSLRWFTPTVEVDLCGHATLASAHVLWERQLYPRTSAITFRSRSGALHAVIDGEWIELDFPGDPPAACEPPAALLEALTFTPVFVGKTGHNYLVVAPTEGEVCSTAPDLDGIRGLNGPGVIVTARSGSQEYDIVSRYFDPSSGIDEDPVTGSAHCSLAPFWGPVLGRDSLVGFQASARGGVVHMKIRGNRVLLRGRAVTIGEGFLIRSAQGQEC